MVRVLDADPRGDSTWSRAAFRPSPSPDSLLATFVCAHTFSASLFRLLSRARMCVYRFRRLSRRSQRLFFLREGDPPLASFDRGSLSDASKSRMPALRRRLRPFIDSSTTSDFSSNILGPGFAVIRRNDEGYSSDRPKKFILSSRARDLKEDDPREGTFSRRRSYE